MIETLSIRNFALFTDSEIDFHSGMNALIGASGAGKSMIIDAISLLKGERSSFEKIRVGEKKATLEGVFLLDEERFLTWKEKYPDVIDENPLIVSRTLDISGKSIVRINGQMVPMSFIKNLMNEEIDIHSQHQNYALLDEKNHLKLLEQFANLQKEKEAYQKEYQLYQNKKQELESLLKLKKDDDEISRMKEEVEAIEKLDLKEGEYQKLLTEQKKIDQLETYLEKYSSVLHLLDDENGVIDRIYSSKRELESLKDDDLDPLIQTLSEMYYALKDIISEVENKNEQLQDGAYKASFIENRLQEIKKVLRKYHYDEEEMNETKENYSHELFILLDKEEAFRKAKSEVEKQYQALLKAGNALSEERIKKAKELEYKVKKEMKDLYLNDANFFVECKKKEPSLNGIDEVRFLLSTNVGTPLLPLSQIASGGESSRIMLALKSVFTTNKMQGTLVYDEVDVGVSGSISSAIGKKIQEISQNRQVLVISHSPQVLSFADYGYEVKKTVVGDSTKSEIVELDEKDFIKGLASLLSGDENLSQNTFKLAQELRKKAKKC